MLAKSNCVVTHLVGRLPGLGAQKNFIYSFCLREFGEGNFAFIIICFCYEPNKRPYYSGAEVVSIDDDIKGLIVADSVRDCTMGQAVGSTRQLSPAEIKIILSKGFDVCRDRGDNEISV